MTVLEMLGKYVQKSLTTVTPKEIAVNFANAIFGHKRARGIWCLTICLSAGIGGGVAFAIDSVPYGYFSPIVLKALPFLGEVGAKIAVGTIGFWICGAFGHQAAKFTAQEFNRRAHGHSNSAYIFSDVDVQRIMDANPQAYAQAVAAADDLEAGRQGNRQIDAAELREYMLHLRDQIDSHRDNRAEHDKYKRALLGLLRQATLRPALETIGADRAERAVRVAWASNMTRFYTGHGAHADEEAAEGAPLRRGRGSVLASESSDGEERRARHAQRSAASSSGEDDLRMERIVEEPAPRLGRDRAEEERRELPIRDGAVALAHMLREAKALNHKDFVSFPYNSVDSATEQLSATKTREVVTALRQAQDSQRRKQTEDLGYVPSAFRRILPF
jgi:hypothetical protein